MSEILNSQPAPAPHLTSWDMDFQVYGCDACHWRYLVPASTVPGLCPHCFRQALTCLPDGLEEMAHPYPPELVLPFQVPKSELEEQMRKFIKGIPFPPARLNIPSLRDTMRAIYLPTWLIDANVSANWQAEAGFRYQVVSHQETYKQDSGWESREVKEPRMRWEPRLGQIHRAYQNVPATALDDTARLEKSLGGFARENAEPYHPAHLQGATVRLPEITPNDAWSEAAAAFQRVAAEECRAACQADEVRQFQWKAKFVHTNWTLLLLPIYSACYQDDEGNPQPVIIHGQAGHITGARKASMHRARRASLGLLLLGAITLLMGWMLNGLAGANPGLSALSMILILLGIASAIGMLVPVAMVWEFNRGQKKTG